MLNAKEARKKTDHGIEEKLKLKRTNSYSVIENLIIEAANNGETKIEYVEYFDYTMTEYMESLGYKVEYANSIATISW